MLCSIEYSKHYNLPSGKLTLSYEFFFFFATGASKPSSFGSTVSVSKFQTTKLNKLLASASTTLNTKAKKAHLLTSSDGQEEI